ncbi:hypothetical protein [Alteribacter lacisalsi]|nr:hypothetical protein [Alteribacter lacisalsi]
MKKLLVAIIFAGAVVLGNFGGDLSASGDPDWIKPFSEGGSN